MKLSCDFYGPLNPFFQLTYPIGTPCKALDAKSVVKCYSFSTGHQDYRAALFFPHNFRQAVTSIDSVKGKRKKQIFIY